MRDALTIVPVTPANREDVLALAVLPHQRRHIESPAECLREAETESRWRTVALCMDGTAVGFAMYGQFPGWTGGTGAQQVWLDRLLIDGRAQGKGYGEAALLALLDRLAVEYGTDTVYLSVYEDNERAIALYKKHGFCFTGDLDTKGEKVMRRCVPRTP